MATSPVEIANLALLTIGEDTIVSFDDPTQRARVVSILYNNTRRQLIREYRWNFSIARTALAPEADAPAFGFTYKFLLPTDCLRVIGNYDGNTSDRQINYSGADTAYKVEGRYILSDANPFYLFYSKDVTNPVEMDASFTQALAYHLAMQLAIPLTNDSKKQESSMQLYLATVRSAKAMSAIETTPEILMASDWIESRYNGAAGPRNALLW